MRLANGRAQGRLYRCDNHQFENEINNYLIQISKRLQEKLTKRFNSVRFWRLECLPSGSSHNSI